MPLPLAEFTAAATFFGAAFTAILKGHEAYEKFRPKTKKRSGKKKPSRKKPAPSSIKKLSLPSRLDFP